MQQNSKNEQNEQPRKVPQTIPQQKQEHPSINYSLTELYMIRKQSIFHSSQLINRRLSRCFQRIKRLKMAERQREIYSQYDQDLSSIRRSWRKVHELYKSGSRVNDITQKKIDKMRARIDKVKREVNQDQSFFTKDIDISKVYIRNAGQHQQQPSSQKNLQK